LALALVAATLAAPIAQSNSAPKVDPLAVSYLIEQGLSPSEVQSWDARRLLTPDQGRLVLRNVKSAAPSSTQVTDSNAFQWSDAGIGAGFTLGIVLLLGGAVAGLYLSRHNRRRQPARA
jgi:hypothetical protein